jgi:hypothetical protein
MTFTSDTVALQWYQNSLVLRRGQTTIQIIPEDATTLRTMKEQETFVEFFRSTALKNREARRVFESWERKDSALLLKVYKEMTEG